MCSPFRVLCVILFVLGCLPLAAAEYTAPTAAELVQAHNWVNKHWSPDKEPTAPPVGMTVYANNDPVRPRHPGADQYNFRSMMCPFQNSSFDVRDENFDFAIARKYQAGWKRCTPYYGQDYYPLTACSLDESAWLAWQYVAYDASGGIVQIFKRSQSPYETARLRMYGLDADAIYVFEDFDGNPEIRCGGKELMEQGLPITIREKRVSRILEFRRAD